MKLRFILLITLTAITITKVTPQEPTCAVHHIPFQSGESVKYKAYYNWGFLWLHAGDVVFSVGDTTYSSNPVYHLKALGWSLQHWDRFFRVRNRFESIVNPLTLQPYRFERDCYEGGFISYNLYEFRQACGTLDMVTHTTERPLKKEILPLKPCVFDVLSAIYYCRSIKFNQYNPGDTIPLTMAIDNGIFDLFIRYLGREPLTISEGLIYNTIKFSVRLVEGTLFKGGEDLTVWVSDDLNMVPLLVESKILLGSVKAVVHEMHGLKHPLTSRIFDPGVAPSPE